MRSLLRIAKREIVTPDGSKHWLYAIAVHEAFDPKESSKWLRLYSTADNIETMKHIFVSNNLHVGSYNHKHNVLVTIFLRVYLCKYVGIVSCGCVKMGVFEHNLT